MTNPVVDDLKQEARPTAPAPRSASHDCGPTPAEIQRWEDDGGALPAEPDRRLRLPSRRAAAGHASPRSLAA